MVVRLVHGWIGVDGQIFANSEWSWRRSGGLELGPVQTDAEVAVRARSVVTSVVNFEEPAIDAI